MCNVLWNKNVYKKKFHDLFILMNYMPIKTNIWFDHVSKHWIMQVNLRP